MPVVVENGEIKVSTDFIDVSGTDAVVLYICMPKYYKFVIKKLIIFNPDSADHKVILGEYDTSRATWNRDKVIIKVPAGEIKQPSEKELPTSFVMTTDPSTAILAWAAKLDAPVTAKPVKIQAEFEVHR